MNDASSGLILSNYFFSSYINRSFQTRDRDYVEETERIKAEVK